MKKDLKFILLAISFIAFAMPVLAQGNEEVTEKIPVWLQFLSDNWLVAASFLSGALLKEAWVLAVNKFIKKSKVIIAKIKNGLEDTEELLDVLENITEDGKINKAEIIEGVEAGKEYYTEIKGIAVSFKKKK